MSTRRLTAKERAIYLLGQVVIRQLQGATRDSVTRQEIAAFSRWAVRWLNDEEFHHATTNTGYLFDEFADLQDLEFFGRSP